MFKLLLFFKLSKTSTKYFKSTPVLLLFLLKLILKKNILIHLNKSILNVKTLMLSPFHYKVAKKNLCIRKLILTCTFKFNSLSKEQTLIFIFFNKFNLTLTLTNLFLFKSKLVLFNIKE